MRRPKPERPGPGQESVWDYPRPPAVREVSHRVEVELGGRVVASCDRAWQVLETSHPPTWYLPGDAFAEGVLRPVDGTTACEWKGLAAYFDLVATTDDGREVVAERAAWTYPDPVPSYAVLRGTYAVMAATVDRCTVDGRPVQPQPGGFYGGWVTPDVVGPFKGIPGSWGW